MRRFSHILSFLAVALFLLFAGSAAKADTADPRTGTGGGGSCLSLGLGSASQTFSGDSALPTECIIDFTNNTGGTITSLTVTILTPFFGESAGSLSCAVYANELGFGSPAPFNTATKTANNACTFNGLTVDQTNNQIVPDAWDPGTVLGLENGVQADILGHFLTPCNDTGVGCAILTQLDVRLDATVPEPGTMVLVGTGLVALVGRKKLKERKRVA
jgi:hypothetical protein